MRIVPVALIIASVCASACFAATSFGPLQTAMQKQHAANQFLFASAVATFSKDGLISAATGSYGNMNPEKLAPMSVDASLRANTFGEVLLAVIVQKLIDSNILPQLDSSIPSRLLPRGVSFIHPNFLGQPLTLRQLMTHTSSLVDNDRFWPQPQVSGGGNAVQDLRTFCDYYYLSESSSGFTLATDIWDPNKEPGEASSYYPARSNTVLLSYVVQQIIADRPQLVTGAQKTVGALIQEEIISPLGMTGTYFLLPDGSVPKVEGGYSTLSGKKVAETTQSGAVADQVPITAGYVADYMLMTTAMDIAKLFRALYVESTGSLAKIGTELVAALVAIPATYKTKPGVIAQGFGVLTFDPAFVCSATTAVTGSPAGCSLTSERPIVGYVAVGTNSAVNVMCTAAPTIQGLAASTTCVTSVHAYHPQATPTTTQSYALSGAAFDHVFIDPSIIEGTTITEDSQKKSGSFAAIVVLALFMCFFSVFLCTYFAEYFVQPAPVSGTVVADAYPKLQDTVMAGADDQNDDY